MERLCGRQLSRRKLAEQLDIVRAREQGKHFVHLAAAAGARQLLPIIVQGFVDHAKTATRSGSVELALRLEIAPEDENVPINRVRAGIEQVARLDDRRASACQVAGDVELAHHVVWINTGSTTRYPRNQWKGLQVHQHVPGAAQDDRSLTWQAIRAGNLDRCLLRTHTTS